MFKQEKNWLPLGKTAFRIFRLQNHVKARCLPGCHISTSAHHSSSAPASACLQGVRASQVPKVLQLIPCSHGALPIYQPTGLPLCLQEPPAGLGEQPGSKPPYRSTGSVQDHTTTAQQLLNTCSPMLWDTSLETFALFTNSEEHLESLLAWTYDLF